VLLPEVAVNVKLGKISWETMKSNIRGSASSGDPEKHTQNHDPTRGIGPVEKKRKSKVFGKKAFKSNSTLHSQESLKNPNYMM
jgi:hypothetical protein